MISAELLEILACPKCKGALRQAEAALECPACKLSYPIVDGIPVMLVEEARPLAD